jgi:hypothetical protein
MDVMMTPKMMFAMRSGERAIVGGDAEGLSLSFPKSRVRLCTKVFVEAKPTKAVNVVSLYAIWRAQEGALMSRGVSLTSF